MAVENKIYDSFKARDNPEAYHNNQSASVYQRIYGMVKTCIIDGVTRFTSGERANLREAFEDIRKDT